MFLRKVNLKTQPFTSFISRVVASICCSRITPSGSEAKLQLVWTSSGCRRRCAAYGGHYGQTVTNITRVIIAVAFYSSHFSSNFKGWPLSYFSNLLKVVVCNMKTFNFLNCYIFHLISVMMMLELRLKHIVEAIMCDNKFYILYYVSWNNQTGLFGNVSVELTPYLFICITND